MFEGIFSHQEKPAEPPQEAAKVPIKQQRCSEHVHFALEFDGLDFCDFLVRDLEAASSSRRPSTHPSSPVVSSH